MTSAIPRIGGEFGGEETNRRAKFGSRSNTIDGLAGGGRVAIPWPLAFAQSQFPFRGEGEIGFSFVFQSSPGFAKSAFAVGVIVGRACRGGQSDCLPALLPRSPSPVAMPTGTALPDVDRGGAKRWAFLFRWKAAGAERAGQAQEMGLGGLSSVSLAEAREKAAEGAPAARQRRIPLRREGLRSSPQAATTFGAFADALVEDLSTGSGAQSTGAMGDGPERPCAALRTCPLTRFGPRTCSRCSRPFGREKARRHLVSGAGSSACLMPRRPRGSVRARTRPAGAATSISSYRNARS